MKKTLITLLALAGVAAGAHQTITLNDYGYTDGFYATSVLSVDQLNSLIGTANVNKAVIGLGVDLDDNSSFNAYMGVRTWNDRNEFHVYYNQDITSGTDVTYKSVNTSFSATDGYTYPSNHAINAALPLTNAVGGVLTFAFAPRNAATVEYGLSVAMTVAYEDNTTITIVGNTTSLSWSNNNYNATQLYYDDSLLTTPTITKSGNWTHDTLVNANMAALVPEPTTATLSLLALAGLAARRRRK